MFVGNAKKQLNAYRVVLVKPVQREFPQACSLGNYKGRG